MCLRAFFGALIGGIIGAFAWTEMFKLNYPTYSRDSGMPHALIGIFFGFPAGGLVGLLIAVAVGAWFKKK